MTISVLERMIDVIPNYTMYGRIQAIQGLIVQASIHASYVKIGTLCLIQSNAQKILAEVVGFSSGYAQLMTYNSCQGIGPGSQVEYLPQFLEIFPCEEWRGRVLNGLGEPVDEKGLLPLGSEAILTNRQPISAHKRQKIGQRMDVGVRALNTFTTCCKGQRLGVFAGSGVGKSMLLSMLAKFTDCDICIIGLIGERGREVRDFIEDTLGEEGLKKSILVVATSDESSVMRRQAAYTALTIAEYFRDQGKSVLCLVDSMTRLAMAQREIGLSIGEPPTTKGYPPSAFSELAKISERAGPGPSLGTITALFSVLVDGDDHNEPIADAMRGILDGHIVLSRQIAERGRYPAIDISRSLSRTVPACHSREENALICQARHIISTYEEMVDMIRLGAYKVGTHPDVDKAIDLYPKIENFLAQYYQEKVSLDDSFSCLKKILSDNNE